MCFLFFRVFLPELLEAGSFVVVGDFHLFSFFFLFCFVCLLPCLFVCSVQRLIITLRTGRIGYFEVNRVFLMGGYFA